MNLTVNQKELSQVLGRFRNIIPKRTFLPICNSVLLEAENGELRITGTSLETWLRVKCLAYVAESGSICVPYKELRGAVDGAANGKLVLIGTGKEFRVVGDESMATLKGEEAQEFPPVPQVPDLPYLIRDLGKALKRVEHAIATEDTRPVLTCACLNPLERGMDVVACDGVILAVVHLETAIPSPTLLMREAAAWLASYAPEEVELRQDEKHVSFRFGTSELIAMRQQGTYPNYSQLIPTGGKPVEVERIELLQALKSLKKAKLGTDKVRCEAREGTMKVWMRDTDGKTAEYQIAATGEMRAAYPLGHLVDIVNVLEGETVRIEYQSPSSPICVRDGNATFVLIPMFVEW